jgi:hypothetical protein
MVAKTSSRIACLSVLAWKKSPSWAPPTPIFCGASTGLLQQVYCDGAIIVHYYGAKDKKPTYVGFSVKREATGLVGKNKRIWHGGDSMTRKPAKPESQVEGFRQAAQDLGCDPSESVFEGALRSIARHKPRGLSP